MRITKTISEEVDLEDAQFKTEFGRIVVYLDGDEIHDKTLCEVNKNTGEVESLQFLRGEKMSPAQFAKRVAIVDKAIRKAGFAGFLKDDELKNEVNNLKEEISELKNEIE